MDQHALLHLMPYLASLALSIAVSIYAWHRRSTTGASAYAWGVMSQASWTLGYTLELTSRDLVAKVFWDNTQFVGMILAPMALLAFAFAYTEYRPSHPRRLWGVLGTIVAVLLTLVFADNLHHQVRPTTWLVAGDPFSTLAYDFGPLAWATFLYSYGVYLASVLLLAHRLWNVQSFYRAQIATILVGTLIPAVGTVVSTARPTPIQYRDMTPFTFAAGNLVIAWRLFRRVRPVRSTDDRRRTTAVYGCSPDCGSDAKHQPSHCAEHGKHTTDRILNTSAEPDSNRFTRDRETIPVVASRPKIRVRGALNQNCPRAVHTVLGSKVNHEHNQPIPVHI